jgi:hypothetical protein
VAEWFGASDVSDLWFVTNVCAVRSLSSRHLDMLPRIKGIFGADHVPVVSSGHSGFKIDKKISISLVTGNSEGGFRSIESGQTKKKVKYE